MDLFLTGGTGLVGSAVLARLPAGVRVRALTRGRPRDAQSDRVTWLSGDLEQPGSIRGVSRSCGSILHCAGIMSTDEVNFRLNRDGTRALLEEALREGIQRFVYVSSTAVYGDGDLRDCGEETSRSGTSSYARSKIEAEDLVLEAAREGMTACIVRPCMISGPGDRNLAPAVAALVQRDEVVLPGGGKMQVDLVDARDVAGLLVRAALDGIGRGAYHAASGAPRKLRDVLAGAARALGVRPVWRELSIEETRMDFARRAARGELSPYEPALLSLAANERTYSITRSRREFGFAPDPQRCPVVEALVERAPATR